MFPFFSKSLHNVSHDLWRACVCYELLRCHECYDRFWVITSGYHFIMSRFDCCELLQRYESLRFVTTLRVFTIITSRYDCLESWRLSRVVTSVMSRYDCHRSLRLSRVVTTVMVRCLPAGPRDPHARQPRQRLRAQVRGQPGGRAGEPAN